MLDLPAAVGSVRGAVRPGEPRQRSSLGGVAAVAVLAFVVLAPVVVLISLIGLLLR